METETEKKVLDFDTKQYEIELAALESMVETAKVFQEAWSSQPILKGIEFDLAHLHGIISHGARYIVNEISKLIAARQEKQLPGLSAQMPAQAVQLINVDAEKLNRIAESITQKHPADKYRWVNHRMLSVVKGKICITDETRSNVKEKLTIYGDDSTLTHIAEIGEMAAGTCSMLLDVIKNRREQKEKASGLKLMDTLELFHTHKPGLLTQNKGPLYYEDNQVKFNLKYFV